MTDLERKLAEALRDQAGSVTPNLDAAWAEQQRRQRRPPRRRKVAVWGAPLAAVLVVLTSVLVATKVNTAPEPVMSAKPGQELVLAKPVISPVLESGLGEPRPLTDFVGQTDTWTSYAAPAYDPAGRAMLCVEALPKGANHGGPESQFGIESPTCVPTTPGTVLAGYVGKDGGPLPAGKAVYLVDPSVVSLALYDAAGDLSDAVQRDLLGVGKLFLADVKPGSPPVRFEATRVPTHPASR